jgi:hypothetical protein
MKILNEKLRFEMRNCISVGFLKPAAFSGKKLCLILLSFALLSSVGCKKISNSTQEPGSYYGYGKLVVNCAGKCNVSFGEIGKMNVYTVEATTATYSFRYQTKYQLGISITPVDKDQNITMDVYSREEKQIFHNTVNQKVNVAWESQILVP